MWNLLFLCFVLGISSASLTTSDGQWVPLKSVVVKASVVDFITRVKISQVYSNDAGVPIEAIYKFPLDDKAAVVEFTATIGDKVLQGICKNKQAARQEYEEAINSGHTTSLLESDDPETFTAHLGNLPANTNATIEITYITELSKHGNQLRFVLPTTIAPRYTPQGFDASPISEFSEGINHVYGLSIDINIEQSTFIESLSSPTHPLTQKILGKKGTVELSDIDMTHDFVLLIEPLKIKNSPSLWVEVSENFKFNEAPSHAGLLSFVPDLDLLPQEGETKKELIFVIDVSGSMEDKMEATKMSLMKAMDEIETVYMDSNLSFNLYSFSDTWARLFEESVSVTPEKIQKARAWISGLDLLGGTELYEVLDVILSHPQSQRQTEIILLTGFFFFFYFSIFSSFLIFYFIFFIFFLELLLFFLFFFFFSSQ